MDTKVEELIENIVNKDEDNVKKCLKDILIRKTKERLLEQMDHD